MALDVAVPCIATTGTFLLGVSTVSVNKFGTREAVFDSGQLNNGNPANQFTKLTVTDTQLAAKLTARFDDARYYTGDATT